MANEAKYDLGRYESAAGWEPEDPWKKEREKIRREEEMQLQPCDSMLELLTANEWIKHRASKKPPAKLCGPLWREGEVAVVIGESGVGKSILAVQLADEIAGTRTLVGVPAAASASGVAVSDSSSLTAYHSPLTTARPKAVLYIDFQRTAAQWAERYTVPSPVPGKLPIRHRFSKRFERAAIDWNLIDSEKFNRDPLKFALHSIYNKIEESGTKVVIIDDMQLGGAALLRPKNATARIMQTLKLWSATQNLSILVLAGVSSPHVSKALTKPSGLSTPVSRHSSLITRHFSVADSIFSLNHSTFGPDYRYVKLLSSKSSPRYKGGLRLQPGGGSSVLDIHHSPEVLTYQLASPSPVSGLSSPVLQFLGPSSESDHLRDYAAEVRKRVQDAVRVQRHALDTLPSDFLDVEVLKYLKS